MKQEVLKVTYELIGPQTNNILLITLDETNESRSVQFSHYWPQDFLAPTLTVVSRLSMQLEPTWFVCT
jgi:hypothetical protein